MTEKNQEETKPVYDGLTLRQRIHKVRCEVTTVAKDANVDGKYSAVTHDAVNRMLMPLLNKWGLVEFIGLVKGKNHATGTKWGSRDLMQYRGVYEYRVACCDDSADKEGAAIMVEAYGDDAGDKGPGKAISYAFKTARMKTFGISTGEDDEERIEGKAPMLTPEQIDTILHTADELFGDDAEETVKRMCDKVFGVPELAMVEARHNDTAIKLLKNQAKRLRGGDSGDNV